MVVCIKHRSERIDFCLECKLVTALPSCQSVLAGIKDVDVRFVKRAIEDVQNKEFIVKELEMNAKIESMRTELRTWQESVEVVVREFLESLADSDQTVKASAITTSQIEKLEPGPPSDLTEPSVSQPKFTREDSEMFVFDESDEPIIKPRTQDSLSEDDFTDTKTEDRSARPEVFGSLPIQVPMMSRTMSTFSERVDEEVEGFEPPHVAAARTYQQEHLTGSRPFANKKNRL